MSLEECAASIFRAKLWKVTMLVGYIVSDGRLEQGALED
jgi:hypothetical protein